MPRKADQSRLQLLLVGVVPLAFLVLLAIVAGVFVAHASRVSLEARRPIATIEQSDAMTVAMRHAESSMDTYLLVRGKLELAAYRRSLAALAASERAFLASVPPDDPVRAQAVHYAGLIRNGGAVLGRYTALVLAGKPGAARAYATSKPVRSLSTEILSAKDLFDRNVRSVGLVRLQGLSQELHSYSYIVFLICLTGVAATLLTVGALDRVSKRLHDAVRQREELLAAYEREHHVASTLQEALLPHQLPVLPNARIDAAYVPAAKSAEVGGDWYDVFTLSDRLVALGVGDVAGHDLHAATVMGGVRQAVRIAAREDPDPARVLRRVNHLLCSGEERCMVTAFFGTLDLANGTLSYASAGHPPPIVIRPDRATELLDGSGILLGVENRAEFVTRSVKLGVGSGIVLYTDGVVEAERDYEAGLRKLEGAIRAEAFSVGGNIAELIQRRVFAGVEPQDDSAILFVGITEVGARAEPGLVRRWTLDAKNASSAHRIKRALLWHLGEIASPLSDFAAVEAIVGELISNVARHTPGEAEVVLECGVDEVRLDVVDQGCPFEHAGDHAPDVLAESGRGLFLVRELSRSVHVERTPEGNRVSVLLPVTLGVPLAVPA
jgi:serine phosphatase RsbU (regulator of sigma subunit)/anti-sigma regulatory factor (Ser/Thr protein kinase)